MIPALEEGAIVLCDRFIDSSLAYQGYARGIGVEAVRAINEFAVEDYMPDLTLYFSVKPEIGLARVKKDQVRDWNRLDQEKLDFHKRVETGYNLINEEAKDRVQVIDANQSMEKVIEETLRIVEKHI